MHTHYALYLCMCAQPDFDCSLHCQCLQCLHCAWPPSAAPPPEPLLPLQALLSLDSNGRQVLPQETKTDHLARAYSMALAAAPLLDASRLGERSLTSRELIRLLVSSVRSGAEQQQVCAVVVLWSCCGHAVVMILDCWVAGGVCHALVASLHMQAASCRHPSCNIATTTWCCPLQATAVLALGNMHPACHALVLAESAVLAEDYPDRQMQRVSERGWNGWLCGSSLHPTKSRPLPCLGMGSAHSNPSRCMLASQPTRCVPCLTGHCHAIHARNGAACAAAGRCAAGACARDAHAGQQPSSGQPGRQCGECGEGVCSLRACGHWISMGLPDGLYPERCPMPGNHADGAQ